MWAYLAYIGIDVFPDEIVMVIVEIHNITPLPNFKNPDLKSPENYVGNLWFGEVGPVLRWITAQNVEQRIGQESVQVLHIVSRIEGEGQII